LDSNKQTIKKHKAGPGRPKGSQNKTTKCLKDMILGALDAAGGEDYLQRQADENPGPFMALIGKVLPSTMAITGPEGKDLKITFEIIRPSTINTVKALNAPNMLQISRETLPKPSKRDNEG
jgi:hypothetical protein